MQFQVELAQWEHPQYPYGFHGLRVERGQAVFVVRTLRLPAGQKLLAFILALAISAALYVLAWWLWKVVLVVFIFAPLVLVPLISRLLGRRSYETVEVVAPLAHIRNVGGGGRYVAFGLLLPLEGHEVAVTVRLPTESAAQDLRSALQAA